MSKYNREELATRVVELHGDGLGRNAIARTLGVHGRIVSELAKEHGLTFTRTATRTATAARVADSRERRSRLAARILDEAESTIDMLAKVGAPSTQQEAAQRARTVSEISRAMESTLRAVPLGDANQESAVSLLTGLSAQIDALPDTYGMPDDERKPS